jgi:hypothetical protein
VRPLKLRFSKPVNGAKDSVLKCRELAFYCCDFNDPETFHLLDGLVVDFEFSEGTDPIGRKESVALAKRQNIPPIDSGLTISLQANGDVSTFCVQSGNRQSQQV